MLLSTIVLNCIWGQYDYLQGIGPLHVLSLPYLPVPLFNSKCPQCTTTNSDSCMCKGPVVEGRMQNPLAKGSSVCVCGEGGGGYFKITL